ncbi:MAG TPA: acyl carrier protein [Gemmatimonadaceae bacterium]|nr:acyl carrier protein [Gemmatimonadaceae bacterium]
MNADRSPEQIIRDVVAAVTLKRTEGFGLDDDLQKLMGIDSLSLLRIVAGIEEEFDVRIPDEELHALRTLRAMLAQVEVAAM